jgi:hypothetical protein
VLRVVGSPNAVGKRRHVSQRRFSLVVAPTVVAFLSISSVSSCSSSKTNADAAVDQTQGTGGGSRWGRGDGRFCWKRLGGLLEASRAVAEVATHRPTMRADPLASRTEAWAASAERAPVGGSEEVAGPQPADRVSAGWLGLARCQIAEAESGVRAVASGFRFKVEMASLDWPTLTVTRIWRSSTL